MSYATLADVEETLARMLTPAKAARELGLTSTRIGQLADERALRCVRTPLGRLYSPDDVARLAKTRAADSKVMTVA